MAWVTRVVSAQPHSPPVMMTITTANLKLDANRIILYAALQLPNAYGSLAVSDGIRKMADGQGEQIGSIPLHQGPEITGDQEGRSPRFVGKDQG